MFTYLFLERGEGKEKERERNINIWLPLVCPPLGTWPINQACALTGNRASGPLAGAQSTEAHQPEPFAHFQLDYLSSWLVM